MSEHALVCEAPDELARFPRENGADAPVEVVRTEDAGATQGG